MHSFKGDKKWGWTKQRRPSLCAGQKKDTHDIDGTETVHATVPKRSVDPKCIPKPFILGAACETSVHDTSTIITL
jgi:hypothetical protein